MLRKICQLVLILGLSAALPLGFTSSVKAQAPINGSVAAPVTGSVASQETEKSLEEKASYIMGRNIAANFAKEGLAIDYKMLIQGIQDEIQKRKSPLSPTQSESVMKTFFDKAQAARKAKFEKMQAEFMKPAAANLKAGAEFLAANKLKPGVKQLPNGVQYIVLKEGAGENPKPTDSVTVHYAGTLLDGTEFDSSVKRGTKATFPLSRVIRGWTETIPRMKIGSKWRIFIPAGLAYGATGSPPVIPPNATLIFEIELFGVKK